MTYAGHMPDGSSIQRHSAGSHYPFIVRIQEHRAEGWGFADVLGPSGDIQSTYAYPIGNKPRRLDAYRKAYETAERFAAEGTKQ